MPESYWYIVGPHPVAVHIIEAETHFAAENSRYGYCRLGLEAVRLSIAIDLKLIIINKA